MNMWKSHSSYFIYHAVPTTTQLIWVNGGIVLARMVQSSSTADLVFFLLLVLFDPVLGTQHIFFLVQRIATIALTPLQHLTQRYIQSWQDGTQVAFLSRFWDSAKRGDAFHLMLDNARKLLHHATAKKEEDTAKKDSK